MTNEEILQRQLDPGQVYIKNSTTGQLDIAGKDEFLDKQAKGTYFMQNGAPTHEIYNAPVGSGGEGTGVTTVGDAYKGLIAGTDSTQDAAYDAYGNILKEQTQPYDENKIRQETTARFQAEIDTLNRMYAEKKAQQLKRDTLAGEGRLGQNAAINARRGLLGSDFGASATDKVVTNNNEIISGNQNLLDTELNARVESILGEARRSADDEIKAKQAARISGAKEYIEFLKGAAERKDKRVMDTVTSMLYGDVAPNDDMYKTLAAQLGVSVQDIKGKYKQARGAYDRENAKENKLMEVSPGASIYDSTGKFIGTAPQKPESEKPVTVEVGNTLLQYDPTSKSWKSIYTSPETSGNQKIVKIDGVDYVQNADGSYSLPKVPTSGKDAEGVAVLQDKVNLVESLLNSKGLSGAVGAYGVSRWTPFTADKAARQDFAAGVNQLISKETMDTLLNLKSRGGTLGALSDQERILLQSAASKIGTWMQRDDSGNPTGKFEISEELFKKELESIKSLTQRALEKAKGVGDDVDTFLDSFNKPLSTGINGSIVEKVATKYPVGAKGGQCGDFAHKLVTFGPVGDGKLQKYKSVDKRGIPASKWKSSPQVGDVIITGENKTYGHVAVVNEVLADGRVRLSESNYRGDEKVTDSRIISVDSPVIYGAIRGTLKV